MTRTIAEQLSDWIVEEPVGDGTFRKVPLMAYVERHTEEAVRAALASQPTVDGLGEAWARAEAALPEHDVIKRLERRPDGTWEVWTGVPDPLSPTADYGYGPGKGDGGWGGDWAEGPTPEAALNALAALTPEGDTP